MLVVSKLVYGEEGKIKIKYYKNNESTAMVSNWQEFNSSRSLLH